jgi:hypothetical protein
MNENMRNEEGTLTTDDIAGADRRDQRGQQEPDEHYFAGAGGGARVVARDPASTPLLDPAEVQQFRSQWDAIQTGFVDEPRHAVEEADELVGRAMKRLATIFSDERRGLEQQWDRDGDVSTEDLRVALQRYRSFFSRLLSI